MKKILIISREEELAYDLQQSLGKFPALFIRESDLGRAKLLLSTAGGVDLAFLDSDCFHENPMVELKDITSISKSIPIFLVADKRFKDLESEAILAGVQYVIEKPIRGDLVAELIARTLRSSTNNFIAPNADDLRQNIAKDTEHRLLQVARNFIEVPRLANSKEAACVKTVSLLREMTGFRKVVVYLLQPDAEDSKKWTLELSYGVGKETLDKINLSADEGLGSHLVEHGQIVQSESLDAQRNEQIGNVFSILAAEAAIPIMAENNLMGVVLVGSRITGGIIDRQELMLLYFLLENLGLYLRTPTNNQSSNTATTNELLVSEIESQTITSTESRGSANANNGSTPTEKFILSSCEEMPSGYILVDRDGKIIMANKKARSLFNLKNSSLPDSSTENLPSVMQEQLQSLFEGRIEKQATLFRHPKNDEILLKSKSFNFPDGLETIEKAGLIVEEVKEIGEGDESITVDPAPKVPIPPQASSESDGKTQIATRDVTDAFDKKYSRIYDKLARQIHYSLVPLSTHSQLLQQGHFDEDFQETLAEVTDSGVEKFTRFSRQLSYMARKQFDLSDKVQWKKIIETSFEEAADFFGDPNSRFELIEECDLSFIQMEEVALRFALSEIFLNALQANKNNPQFLVKVRNHFKPNEPKRLEIIVRDMGDGFEELALDKAFEPFFSTRPAGLGLGLTLAKSIIEGHYGGIFIRRTPAENQHEIVAVLPICQ